MNSVLGADCGLHHIGIWTADLEASLRFYEKGLGFTKRFSYFDPKPYRTVFLDSGVGILLELFDDPDYKPKVSTGVEIPLTSRPLEEWRPYLTSRGSLFHFALRTTRLEAALNSACEYGGRVAIPPHRSDLESYKGEGVLPTFWCYVEGPSGEWVELIEVGDLPTAKST